MRGETVVAAVFVVAVVAPGLGLLAGCAQSGTRQCGELICPADRICDSEHGRCVFPEQGDVCAGSDDGAPCAFPGSTNGRCDAEVCIDVVCGNGLVDPGEACDDGDTEDGGGCNAGCTSDESCGNGFVDPNEECDDGNAIDGDGCQSDCQVPRCGDDVRDPGEACDDGNLLDRDGCNAVCTSTEVCGNLWTDFPTGEQCDDGGFASHDGCDSGCFAELPLWTEIEATSANTSNRSAMVYDAARELLVTFSGAGPIGEPNPSTLEFRSGKWVSVSTQNRPSPRVGHVFAYDASRRFSVLFGGAEPVATPPAPGDVPGTTGERYGDTWVYDGRWRQLNPASSPPALLNAAGAYDAQRAQTVIFGGDDGEGPTADTWLFDGSNWTRVAVSGPPARSGHVMAFDTSRGRTVLFGGVGSADEALTDTWEWDGSAWSEVATATVPTASGAAAYHAGLQRVVLFGGAERSNDTTWEFDGVDWAQNVAPGPSPRLGPALAYDAERDAVVSFGGLSFPPPGPVEDNWLYRGDGWSEEPFAGFPPARIRANFAYDSMRGRMLYGGGNDLSTRPPTPLFDLWEWDGASFVEIDDIGAPDNGLQAPQFVFDRARGVFVAIRSDAAGQFETYEIAGRVWRRIATTATPPPRRNASLVYDDARGSALLFGGNAADGPRNDTWAFDGTAWTEIEPTTSPPARTNAMIAHNRALGHTVLFGGLTPGDTLGDTWVFEDDDWKQVSGPAPPPRSHNGLVYYPPRGVVHLYAGEPGPLDDNWEFDGESWSEITSPVTPGPRPLPGIGVDERRRRIVMFGGQTASDLWEFTYSSTIADEECANDTDDDGDGLLDCDDPDCEARSCGGANRVCATGECSCVGGPSEMHCDDEFDGDCDGLIDCDDPDCEASAACTAESDCGNGLDDDGDGRSDCLDPGCVGVGACEAFESSCLDGLDNDGDGDIDCGDLDCFLVACPEVIR